MGLLSLNTVLLTSAGFLTSGRFLFYPSDPLTYMIAIINSEPGSLNPDYPRRSLIPDLNVIFSYTSRLIPPEINLKMEYFWFFMVYFQQRHKPIPKSFRIFVIDSFHYAFNVYFETKQNLKLMIFRKITKF